MQVTSHWWNTCQSGFISDFLQCLLLLFFAQESRCAFMNILNNKNMNKNINLYNLQYMVDFHCSSLGRVYCRSFITLKKCDEEKCDQQKKPKKPPPKHGWPPVLLIVIYNYYNQVVKSYWSDFKKLNWQENCGKGKLTINSKWQEEIKMIREVVKIR